MASATPGWDARNILNTARLNPAASRFKCYFQQNRLEPSQNPPEIFPKLCEINLSSTSACLPKLPKPFLSNPLRTFRNLQGLHCERAQNLKPSGSATHPAHAGAPTCSSRALPRSPQPSTTRTPICAAFGLAAAQPRTLQGRHL